MFAVLFICVSGRRTFQTLLPLALQFVVLQIFMDKVLCRHTLPFVLGVCSGMGCYSKWLSYTLSVGNSMETRGYRWESPTLWNGCFIAISLHLFQQSLCVALVLLRSVKCNSLWFGFAFFQTAFSDHLSVFSGQISIQTFFCFWYSLITELSTTLYKFLI